MGFLIDTCIWIDVEQGMLAPADVAAITGNAPVYGLLTRNKKDFEDIPGLDLIVCAKRTRL
jgi:hypothetical protein